MDDQTVSYQAERPRLLRIARRLLGDSTEAEDVVQQAWLRLHGTSTDIENLPGWLTTVTTRLCLDRLRAKTPLPVEEIDVGETAPDPADEVALADTVGIALQVVLDRLSPGERVAFVLHDSFGVDFPTIAEILGSTPVAARKLASRARNKVAQPAAQDHQPDWAVVDAFMAAARGEGLQPTARAAGARRRRLRRRRGRRARHAGTPPRSPRGRHLLQRGGTRGPADLPRRTSRSGMVPPRPGQGRLRLHDRRRRRTPHPLPGRPGGPRPSRLARRQRPALTSHTHPQPFVKDT